MDEKSPLTSPADDGANSDLPEEATSDSSTSMPDNAVGPDQPREGTLNSSPSKEALQPDLTENSSLAEPRAGDQAGSRDDRLLNLLPAADSADPSANSGGSSPDADLDAFLDALDSYDPFDPEAVSPYTQNISPEPIIRAPESSPPEPAPLIQEIQYGSDDDGNIYYRVILSGDEEVLLSGKDLTNRFKELERILAKKGILLVARDKRNIREQIQRVLCEIEFAVVNKTGIRDQAIVTSTRVYGRHSLPILLHPALWEGAQPKQTNSVSVSPALREWQKIIRKYCEPSPLAIFALCLSFTAPILKILGCKGMGVIFFGPESPGDILGPIAASVWGPYDSIRLPWQDGLKFRGRSSCRADVIERHLRLHAEELVVVDENSLRGSQRKAGQLLHDLGTLAAEGFSDGNSGERSPFVFMGETACSPEALLSAARLELDPTRLIGIPASAPTGCWPFGDLHDFSSASRLGTYLGQILSPLSGVPISQYMTNFAKQLYNIPRLVKDIESVIYRYEQNHREFAVEAVDERRVAVFSVIYAAGVFARIFRVLPFSEEEIREAVKYCENAYFYHYTDIKETNNPVKAVAQFLANHYPNFWKVPITEGKHSSIPEVLGFYTVRADGSLKEILVSPGTFREHFRENALRACDAAGYMIRDSGTFQSKCQLCPGKKGRHYMYRFKASILELL